MDWIHQYILSIVVVALICSIAKMLSGKNTGYSSIISLISGAFIVVTILAPWVGFDEIDLQLDFENIQSDAREAVEAGTAIATTELRTIIKEQTETYIQDKASSMDAVIDVNVVLAEDEPNPISAEITGTVSPYVKSALSNYMTETFAISEELQKWQ